MTHISSRTDFNMAGSPQKPIRLALALQGGGAHGAFTKGALTRLLSDPLVRSGAIEIVAISGTSAGAKNAVLTAYGLNEDNPDLSIDALDRFWSNVRPYGRLLAFACEAFHLTARHMDPYRFFFSSHYPNIPRTVLETMRNVSRLSPLSLHLPSKLEEWLDNIIPDWTAIQNGRVKLFINTLRENPVSGALSQHVLTGRDLIPGKIAASGALREFGGVAFDGYIHYDGAYWRNPCTDDLMREDITDMLAITIQDHPGNVNAIHQDWFRENTARPGHKLITGEFHHHLHWLDQQYKGRVHIHAIEMRSPYPLNETSRMNTDPKWLDELDALGQKAADKWLRDHAHALGRNSTLHGSVAPEPAWQSAPAAA